MGKPFLPNVQDIIAAGIDPKTGLPIKFVVGKREETADNARRMFRIIDEQNAVNRFNWINLPDGLDGKLLERIIYYKGQGAFFYWEEKKKFAFLPFTLADGLDEYGRFESIYPIPFMGTLEDKKRILGTAYKVKYAIELNELESEDIMGSAVILRDYTQQLSQTIVPRAVLQEWIVNAMGETAAFLRTKLLIGTGINGLKCNGADQIGDVKDLSRAMADAALSGDPFVGVEGASKLELESLDKSTGSAMRAEDYLIALQSYDNIRLGAYGLDNGGIFEKKAHITNQELAMNGSSVGMVYQDCLANRQEFCDIVNSIWGLNIDCVPSETVIGTDMDQDGYIADEENASVETPKEEEDATTIQS